MKMIILLFTLIASLNFTNAFELPPGCRVTVGLAGTVGIAGIVRTEGANHQVTWGLLQGQGPGDVTPPWMSRRGVRHHSNNNVYVIVPIGLDHAQRLTAYAQTREGEYVVEKSCVYIRGPFTNLKANVIRTTPGGLGYEKETVYLHLSDNSILGGVLEYAGDEPHPPWVAEY